jgi:signal transduction histidine kinase
VSEGFDYDWVVVGSGFGGSVSALRQVLLNLIFNAREATPTGGMIRISTYADAAQGRTCIQVTDNGAGISGDRLGTIFEPFNSSRSQRPGLGMYLCRQVVQQHRGWIDISSKVGGGTAVVVGLPWREDSDD